MNRRPKATRVRCLGCSSMILLETSQRNQGYCGRCFHYSDAKLPRAQMMIANARKKSKLGLLGALVIMVVVSLMITVACKWLGVPSSVPSVFLWLIILAHSFFLIRAAFYLVRDGLRTRSESDGELLSYLKISYLVRKRMEKETEEHRRYSCETRSVEVTDVTQGEK